MLVSKLTKPNLAWDKVQLAVFFAQETFLSLLYIRETQLHLKKIAPMHGNKETLQRVLHHLILINIFIICLDISLIGVCYSSLFYVQGHYKPCVYGIKLRMEFTILNDLRTTLQSSRQNTKYSHTQRPRAGSDSNIELTQGSRTQDTTTDLAPNERSQGTELLAHTSPVPVRYR